MPVYFIRNERTGLTKVGYSANVLKRVETLRTASGDHLTLLRALLGGTDLELVLHRQFKELHERGEWFRLTDEHISADYGVPDAAGVVDAVPAGRGRRPIGERAMTAAERQARRKARIQARLASYEERQAQVMQWLADALYASPEQMRTILLQMERGLEETEKFPELKDAIDGLLAVVRERLKQLETTH